MVVLHMTTNKVTKELISVIIPNWNGAKHIVTCLESVVQSSYRTLEIIVVDNGSTDESIALITKNFPDVKILKFNSNNGFSVAINVGIKESQGEFIFLLNNDMKLDPNCIERLCSSLCNRPNCSMATGKVIRFDQTDHIDSAGDSITTSCAPFNRGHLHKDSGQYNNEELIFGGCAGATLYRRELFSQIGTFDETFFAYMEDVDFNCRALLTGHNTVYIPGAITYHHGNATFGTFSFAHVFYTNRNTLFVLLKNYRLRWIIRYFMEIFRHQLKMAYLFSTTERGWSFLRSRLSAILKVPYILLKRHAFLRKFAPDWNSLFSFMEKNNYPD